MISGSFVHRDPSAISPGMRNSAARDLRAGGGREGDLESDTVGYNVQKGSDARTGCALLNVIR